MNNQNNIFGRRLRLARQKEKLSMEELSRKTGNAVSKQTISKYESGKVMAGSTILGKLADALNVSMEYFFRPFTFNLDTVNISFRKKCNVNAKDESALKSKIQDKIERYLEIENILSIDSTADEARTNYNIYSDTQIKQLAIETRRLWKIGNAPIENARETLIRHGIKVFDVDGPEGFDGVSGKANNQTLIIVLNKNMKHIERKRLTIFHEYAHLLANDFFDNSLTTREKESLCNVFASEMLLPSEVLMKSFGNKSRISLQELISVQNIYGISIDAIMYSLKRLSIINDKRYKSYCIKKNMNYSFKKAVEYSTFKEKKLENGNSVSNAFADMVYSALAQRLITTAKAAEFLECNIADVQPKAISF